MRLVKVEARESMGSWVLVVAFEHKGQGFGASTILAPGMSPEKVRDKLQHVRTGIGRVAELADAPSPAPAESSPTHYVRPVLREPVTDGARGRGR